MGFKGGSCRVSALESRQPWHRTVRSGGTSRTNGPQQVLRGLAWHSSGGSQRQSNLLRKRLTLVAATDEVVHSAELTQATGHPGAGDARAVRAHATLAAVVSHKRLPSLEEQGGDSEVPWRLSAGQETFLQSHCSTAQSSLRAAQPLCLYKCSMRLTLVALVILLTTR